MSADLQDKGTAELLSKCVHGMLVQLTHGNAHAVDAKIPQSKNALSICHNCNLNAICWPVAHQCTHVTLHCPECVKSFDKVDFNAKGLHMTHEHAVK